MKFYWQVLACALISTLANVAVQAATITTYSNRTAFDLAVGPSVVETLNDFTVGTSFSGTPLDVGDLTLLVTTSEPAGFIADGSGLLNIDGTPFGSVNTQSSRDMVFTFHAPTLAFGLDVRNLNDLGVRTTVEADGQSVPIGALPDAAFFGFSSDMEFTEVRFVGGIADTWGFDNITYASVDPIPIPAALPLFISAIASIGFVGWRSTRAT